MEVKVNKEIRDYTECIYFGLSLRQFVFSLFACGVAAVLFFFFFSFIGIETLSWICMLGAFPFAIIGFVKYNGMNAEEVIKVFVQNEILTKRKLTFIPINFYCEIIKKEKEGDDKKNEIY